MLQENDRLRRGEVESMTLLGIAGMAKGAAVCFPERHNGVHIEVTQDRDGDDVVVRQVVRVTADFALWIVSDVGNL